MPWLRLLLSLALLVMTSQAGAQTPPERIQTGFKTLSTGTWESALREWAREGVWVDVEGKVQSRVESLIPAPRSVGRWEAVNLPHLTVMWQRHWMMASFDQGALYFLFDYAHHKGLWRLVSLQVTKDPGEVLPHLDLLPAVMAIRNGQ